MTNRTTKKQYDEIKNKLYTVVSFDITGRRTMTYCGCSIVQATQEIILRQSLQQTCILIEGDLPGGEVSRDRKDYDKYLNIKEAI